MTADLGEWHVCCEERRRLAFAGKEGDDQDHFRMSLGEASDVTVHDFIRLPPRWVLALHLDRTDQLVAVDCLGRDEVEPFVAMRKVDIPAGISEASGDVEFSKVVRDFHWFGFAFDQDRKSTRLNSSH